jgi:hypothetical protein
MSHTIYAAQFGQTIIPQHLHLRRKSQSQSINRSFVHKAKEGRLVRILYLSFNINHSIQCMAILIRTGLHEHQLNLI